jgi:hypothetical protein
MRTIDRIIITCCQRDFWLTRICVASIRYWHPDVPIGLLKDVSLGDFSTRELEEHWNVSPVIVPDPARGPFTKLEAFHLPGRQRILLLDSDTVFLGPLLEKLEACEGDFVVNWGGTKPLTPEKKQKHARNGYYLIPEIHRFFPDLEVPDFFFNSGHLVLTTSLLSRETVETNLEGTPPRQTLRNASVFRCYDQGLLNVLLRLMEQRGQCTVRTCDFVLWSRHPEMMDGLDIARLADRRGYPFLIHWAEAKSFCKSGFTRGDLLGFYEDYYYSRIPAGDWKRNLRLMRRARASLTPRIRAALVLSNYVFDPRKLIRLEKTPGKAADPCAHLAAPGRPKSQPLLSSPSRPCADAGSLPPSRRI